MSARKTGAELKASENLCVRRPARDRIFETAKELFYQHGIRAVGVDAIAASADATKMTLYRNFPSKDELVAEVLREEVREYWGWWDEISAEYAHDPRGNLLAVIDAVAERCCCVENSYGCALANAAIELHEAEHPARKVAVEHRCELRRRLLELTRKAGAETDELADGLILLMDGASTSRATMGAGGSAKAISRVARTLLEVYLPRENG